MGFSLVTDVGIEEIAINRHGDKIFISSGDSLLFDRFVKCFDFIIEQSKLRVAELTEIENRFSGKDDTEDEIKMAVEMSHVNVDFSTKAIQMIDGIFGEGTVRKYFRDHYEKIPSFLPGVDCFMEFIEKMSPIMEDIFGKLIMERDEASKERMAKYTPQDHKKPQAPKKKRSLSSGGTQ